MSEYRFEIRRDLEKWFGKRPDTNQYITGIARHFVDDVEVSRDEYERLLRECPPDAGSIGMTFDGLGQIGPDEFREFQASIEEAVRKLNAFLESTEKTAYTLERLPHVYETRRSTQLRLIATNSGS